MNASCMYAMPQDEEDTDVQQTADSQLMQLFCTISRTLNLSAFLHRFVDIGPLTSGGMAIPATSSNENFATTFRPYPLNPIQRMQW